MGGVPPHPPKAQGFYHGRNKGQWRLSTYKPGRLDYHHRLSLITAIHGESGYEGNMEMESGCRSRWRNCCFEHRRDGPGGEAPCAALVAYDIENRAPVAWTPKLDCGGGF